MSTPSLIFLIIYGVIALSLLRWLFFKVWIMIVYISTGIKLARIYIKQFINWSKMKKAKKEYEQARTDYTEHQNDEHVYHEEVYSEKRARYFRTLGLEPGASKDEIKTAYYKLAKLHHPDHFLFEDEKIKHGKIFVEIKDAYEHALRSAI